MYVEYRHESESLYETVQAVPEADVEVRNIATGAETPLRLACTVSGDEASQFKTVAEGDRSVAEIKCLENGDVRKLYWIKLVSGTAEQRAYEAAVDSGGVYLQSRRSRDGWYTTMNYPDQESFQEFQRRVSEQGIKIEPKVVRSGHYLLSGGAFDLTEKQEIVLREAIDTGYFEIPREGSLTDIAERLDISEQAVSERIRRALGELADAAVTTDNGKSQ